MQTTQTKHKNNITKKLSGVDSFIFAALCILIFYPPFFRGLFFQKELLITHILSFSLGAIWLYTKRNVKEFKLITSITDLCALAVVFMYFISTFYGVNTRLAIAEFLKYANYFLIYLMIKNYSSQYKGTKKNIVNVLLLSGVVVAIIGVGSAIGTFSYNGAFVGNRINSTFQYPNTLASYLIALFILALGLLQTSENKKEIYGYAALLNLFMFTFIPTMSRGMWLIAPIILFIYFILIPVQKKLDMFIYSIIIIVPAVGFSALFIQRLGSSSASLWGILSASIATTVVLTVFKTKVLKKTTISYKAVISTITILIVLLGAMATMALNITEPLNLSNIGHEDNKTNSLTRNISEVLKNKEYTFNADAIANNPEEKAYAGRIDIHSMNSEGKPELLVRETINESKNIGTSFTTLETTEYIMVRFINYYGETEITFNDAKLYDSDTEEKIKDIKLKYKYIPEQLISRLDGIKANERSVQGRLAFYRDGFKLVKDYPILGAGGGAWETLYSVYQSYMYWTTQAHNYFLQLWIEVGAMGVLAYGLFIITLLYSIFKTIKDTDDTHKKTIEIGVFVAWITILVHSAMDFDLSLGAMQILLWALYGLTTQKTIISDKKIFKYGVNIYIPITIVVILLLGSVSIQTGQSYAGKAIAAYNEKDIGATIKHFEKAQKFDPYTASYPTDLAQLYRALGNNDEAYIPKSIESLDRAVELQPYDTGILKKAIELNIQLGRFDEGLKYSDQIVKVQPMNIDNYLNQTKAYLAVSQYFIDTGKADQIEKLKDKLTSIRTQFDNANEKSLETFKYNKELDYNLQKIDYALDNDMEKLENLNKVIMYNAWKMDLDSDGIPDGTRVTNTEKGNAKLELVNGIVSLVNDGEDYGIFRMDTLPLEPNHSYTMEIEYTSTVEDNNFDIYVDDLTDGTNRFGKLDNIEKTDELKTIQLKLDLTKDMKEDKQRLLIIHRGNDDGEIKIGKISIIEE